MTRIASALLALALPLLVLAAPAAAAPPPGHSPDATAYLNAHNSFRAQHGAARLVWNQTLADAAQSWVNKCVFKHSGGAVGPYGENLAAGTEDYGIASAVKS